MEVQIKRIDTSLPLPTYQTSGSAAFDLYSRIPVSIAPHTLEKVPSNLIICTPPGYVLILSARSSLAYKKGLMLPNGIGVIDSDYCGPNDEILLSLYNFTNTVVSIEPGERLVQGMFLKIEQSAWLEVHDVENESRGGFGSTGISV